MRKSILRIALFGLLTICLMASALAEGDGSGGGSNVGLALAESSVPDGAVDVALDVSIILTFNKNVVNMSVKDNNMGCFSLAAASGEVPVSVLMGDDQVDPSVKRIVTIKPKSQLSPDSVYSLTISKDLTSKSESSLGQDVTLRFTTRGAPAAPGDPSPSPVLTPAATPSPSEPPAVPAASAQTTALSPSPSVSAQTPSQTAVPASEKPTPGAVVPSDAPEAAPDPTAATPPQNPPPDGTASPDLADDVDADDSRPMSPFVYGIGAAVIVIAGTAWMLARKKK